MVKYIVNEDNERPVCANCQSEILDEEYLMIRDNFLLVKYFDDPDGLDNIFCSEHCICESLSVAGVEIVEEQMKQLLRSIGFILMLYSVAPNIIHEMTLAQKIMFGFGASWLFYKGERK